jgi:hypothetical protein
MGVVVLERTDLAWNGKKWQAPLKAVMKFRVPLITGNFLTS